MADIVIDSCACIEYLDGSKRGAGIRDIIEDERNKLYTHPVSVAEIVSKQKRRGIDPAIAWNAIANLSRVLRVEESDPVAVGLTHAEIKSRNKNFGLADTFVLQAARKIGGRVLTGDPDFKGVAEAILVN